MTKHSLRRLPKKHKGKSVLITGSAGLIGSESVKWFCELGFRVIGIDNNMRSFFFGKEANVEPVWRSLQEQYPSYTHISADIRDQKALLKLFHQFAFDLVIHSAGQPSHDWAAKDPITDFQINTLATVQLLELVRHYSPQAVLIFTSSNKVYGTNVNSVKLKEYSSRYDTVSKEYFQGITEQMSIDHAIHSFYGVSKASADLAIQEYGKYFRLKTGIFRCSCITGPYHTGVVLHGFLSYLAKCIISGRRYVIYGYKGKQVRDNLHAHDLVQAFYHYYLKPKCGAVYNIGGGRENSISVIEAIDAIERITAKKAHITYRDKPRRGDFRWYISDTTKFQLDYPDWKPVYAFDTLLNELCGEQK